MSVVESLRFSVELHSRVDPKICVKVVTLGVTPPDVFFFLTQASGFLAVPLSRVRASPSPDTRDTCTCSIVPLRFCVFFSGFLRLGWRLAPPLTLDGQDWVIDRRT